MYNNDVANFIKPCSYAYLCPIVHGSYCHQNFNQTNSDLSSASLWAKHNSLSLNDANTRCLFVQLTSRVCLIDLPPLLPNGGALSFRDSFQNVGVIMNSRLIMLCIYAREYMRLFILCDVFRFKVIEESLFQKIGSSLFLKLQSGKCPYTNTKSARSAPPCI